MDGDHAAVMEQELEAVRAVLAPAAAPGPSAAVDRPARLRCARAAVMGCARGPGWHIEDILQRLVEAPGLASGEPTECAIAAAFLEGRAVKDSGRPRGLDPDLHVDAVLRLAARAAAAADWVWLLLFQGALGRALPGQSADAARRLALRLLDCDAEDHLALRMLELALAGASGSLSEEEAEPVCLLAVRLALRNGQLAAVLASLVQCGPVLPAGLLWEVCEPGLDRAMGRGDMADACNHLVATLVHNPGSREQRHRLAGPVLEQAKTWHVISACLSGSPRSLAFKRALFVVDLAVDLAEPADERWAHLLRALRQFDQMATGELSKLWASLGPLWAEPEPEKAVAAPPLPVLDGAWVQLALRLALEHDNPDFRALAHNSFVERAARREKPVAPWPDTPLMLGAVLGPEGVRGLVKTHGADAARTLVTAFVAEWLPSAQAEGACAALYLHAVAMVASPTDCVEGELLLDALLAVPETAVNGCQADKTVLQELAATHERGLALCADPAFALTYLGCLGKALAGLCRFAPPSADGALALGGLEGAGKLLSSGLAKVADDLRAWLARVPGSAVAASLAAHVEDPNNAAPRGVPFLWALLPSVDDRKVVLLAACRAWATTAPADPRRAALAAMLAEVLEYVARGVGQDALSACLASQPLAVELVGWASRTAAGPGPARLLRAVLALPDGTIEPQQRSSAVAAARALAQAAVGDGSATESGAWAGLGAEPDLLQHLGNSELVGLAECALCAAPDSVQMRLLALLAPLAAVEERALAAGLAAATDLMCAGPLDVVAACAPCVGDEARRGATKSLLALAEQLSGCDEEQVGPEASRALVRAMFACDALQGPTRARCWTSLRAQRNLALALTDELLWTQLAAEPSRAADWAVPYLQELLLEGGALGPVMEGENLVDALCPKALARFAALKFIESWPGDADACSWLLELARKCLEGLARPETRTNAMQAVCVLTRRAGSASKADVETLFELLLTSTFADFKGDMEHRYYLELAITSLALAQPELLLPKFLALLCSFEIDTEKEMSVIPIAGSVLRYLREFGHEGPVVEGLLDDIAHTLVPYLASSTVQGREFSQWGIQHILKRKEGSELDDPRLEGTLRFLEASKAAAKSRGRLSIRLDLYDPRERSRARYLFADHVSAHPFRAILARWFERGLGERSAASALQPAEAASPAALNVAATKAARLAQRQPRFEAIVQGSLVHKVPNAAGLTRTCEMLGFAELVLQRPFQKERDFVEIVSSADSWMDVSYVPFDGVPDHLAQLKSQGYRIIALEQSANSVCITQYRFPPGGRVVFLLGTEKQGIATHLLQLVDDCIEIPQFGVTRSLNVHASCALLLWEYMRQQLA